MSKCIWIVLGLLIITGCATAPSRVEMKTSLEGYQLPQKKKKDESLIYVVRPGVLGSVVRFNVFLDSEVDQAEMGWNRGDQYIYFYAKPGKHNILSRAENLGELRIETKANEVYYIRQTAHMGFIMAQNSLSLLSPLEGKYWVKNTSQGKIIKTEEKKYGMYKGLLNARQKKKKKNGPY